MPEESPQDAQNAPEVGAAGKDTSNRETAAKPAQTRKPQATQSAGLGICPYCGKPFDAARSIEYSIRGTEGREPVTCPKCGGKIEIRCTVSYCCSPVES